MLGMYSRHAFDVVDCDAPSLEFDPLGMEISHPDAKDMSKMTSSSR